MAKKITSIGIIVILIITTLSVLSVMVISSNEMSFQDNNNHRLYEIDMMNNQLVEACNWDVPRGLAVDLCDKQMKEAWDSSCQDNDMTENLSSCSKIELYLQDRKII